MANYSLVVDSQFEPFTYQELLSPVMAATQAHQQLEDLYGQYSSNADIWKSILNEQTDPESYAQYNRYMTDLSNQAEILSKEGLNGLSRKKAYDMVKRYSSEIAPLKTAYDKRAADIQRERDLYDRDQSIISNRSASSVSLDEYLNGKSPDYRYVSGDKLTNDVAAIAKVLSDDIMGIGKGDYIDAFMTQYGFTAPQIMRAIHNPNDPKNSEVLNAMVESVINNSGIKEWGDDRTVARGYDYARRGLWAAEGIQKLMDIPSSGRGSSGSGSGFDSNSIPINPHYLYSSFILPDSKIDLRQEYPNFFETMPNGKVQLNTEGLNAYLTKENPYYAPDYTNPYSEGAFVAPQINGKQSDSRFKSYIDELVGNTDGKMSIQEINDKLQEISLNDNTFRPDTIRSTEFEYNPNPSDQKDIKTALIRGMDEKNPRLREVTFNSKSNSYEYTRDHGMSIDDLLDKDCEIITTYTSVYGNIVKIRDKHGKIKKYEIPRGINSENEQARDTALQLAHSISDQLVADLGKKDDDETRLSVEDKKAYLAQYKDLLQQAMMHHAQLFGANETQNTKYKMMGY